MNKNADILNYKSWISTIHRMTIIKKHKAVYQNNWYVLVQYLSPDGNNQSKCLQLHSVIGMVGTVDVKSTFNCKL